MSARSTHSPSGPVFFICPPDDLQKVQQMRSKVANILKIKFGIKLKDRETLSSAWEFFKKQPANTLKTDPASLRNIDIKLSIVDEFIERIQHGYKLDQNNCRVDKYSASIDFLVAAIDETSKELVAVFRTVAFIVPPNTNTLRTNRNSKKANTSNDPQKKGSKNKPGLTDSELIEHLLKSENTNTAEDESLEDDTKAKNEQQENKKTELEILRQWFAKFPKPQKIESSQFGIASDDCLIEFELEEGWFKTTDPSYQHTMAVRFPNVLLEDGNAMPFHEWLNQEPLRFTNLATQFYSVRKTKEFTGEIEDKVTEIYMNYTKGGVLNNLFLSHLHEIDSVKITLKDGNVINSCEVLECRLGGAFIDLPENVKEVVYRVKPRDSNKMSSYNESSLSHSLPKGPKLFADNSGFEELGKMVGREHLPALVSDYLTEEGITYCLGTNIHHVIETAASNWIPFSLGLKTPGKCAQLSSLVIAGNMQFGFPALMSVGCLPKFTTDGEMPYRGSLMLNRGHAQTLVITRDQIHTIDLVPRIRQSKIKEGALQDRANLTQLQAVPNISPEKAYESGAYLNPKIIELLDSDNLSEDPRQHPMDTKAEEELLKDLARAGFFDLDHLPRIPIKLLMRVAKGLRDLRSALLASAQSGDLTAVNQARHFLDNIKISTDGKQFHIARILHRTMTIDMVTDFFITNQVKPQAAAPLLDLLVQIGKCETVPGDCKYPQYLQHAILESAHYCRLVDYRFLNSLSNRQLAKLSQIVEAIEQPSKERNAFCANWIYSHYRRNGFEYFINSLSSEYLRRKISPSPKFIRASIVYIAEFPDRYKCIGIKLENLEKFEELFYKAFARLALDGKLNDTLKNIRDNQSKGWGKCSPRAAKLKRCFEEHAGDFLKANFKGNRHCATRDELDKYFPVYKLKQLAETLSLIGELSEDGKLQCSNFNHGLSVVCHKHLEFQANDLGFDFINPPLSEYPLSNYIRRSSGNNAELAENICILFNSGLVERKIVFIAEDQSREREIAEKAAQLLANKKSHFSRSFCAADSSIYDEKKVIQAIECTLPLLAAELPAISQFAKFLNIRSRNGEMLEQAAKIAPDTFKEISRLVAEYKFSDMLQFLADFAHVVYLQISSLNQFFPAMVLADTFRVKNNVKFNQVAANLAKLPNGINSNESEIANALEDFNLPPDSYTRAILGEIDSKNRAAAILFVYAAASKDCDKTYRRNHYGGTTEATARKYLFQALQPMSLLSARAASFTGTNFAVDPDPVGKATLFLLNANTPKPAPNQKLSDYEKDFSQSQFEFLLKQALEDVLKLASRMQLRAKGKSIVNYEHQLKQLGAKRLTSSGEREFVSIRRYAPGDDLRRLNHRVYARTGVPYTNQIKITTDERDLVIVVDASKIQILSTQICDEIMTQIVLGATSEFRKVDLVISAGATIARFENLNMPVSGLGMKFRSHEFISELARALSCGANLSFAHRETFKLSPLAFALKPEEKKQATYLIIPGPYDQTEGHTEVAELQKRGNSIFQISTQAIHKRHWKLRPEPIKSESKMNSSWRLEETSIPMELRSYQRHDFARSQRFETLTDFSFDPVQPKMKPIT